MDFLENTIKEIQDRGFFRVLQEVGSPQGPVIRLGRKRVLNFCSNNYLGIANDPRLIQAAVQALRKYGAGSGAARLISGNHELHDALESSLARFKGAEAALLFNSGYHANIGVIPALASEDDIIFSDELNHASLIDGCRLSKAKTIIYRHNDLNHLEDLLRRGAVSAPGRGNPAPTKRIIVTETVFSMEGDLCQLPDLIALAEKYDAHIYLDEAHAVGIFGKNGQGLLEEAHPLVIAMGTLGKAFGSYGAFIAGSKRLKDFLINRARSFIFTTALPPPVVGASLAALRIIQKEPQRREKLWENMATVGRVLPKPLLASPDPTRTLSPIFSLPIGDARKTMAISRKLLDEGIYVQGIRPPTVPEGTSRLRLTVMATHTQAQINRLLEALRTIKN